MAGVTYDHLYKVILIGDSSVGKTCLLHQYTKGTMPDSPSATTAPEFDTSIVELKEGDGLKGCKVKAQIWDTAGQEKFRSVTNAHYRGAKGVLLVYDVTKRDTFENCKQVWREELLKHCDSDCVIYLVGNKADLVGLEHGCEVLKDDHSQRQVTRSDVTSFGCNEAHYEVSAANGAAFRRDRHMENANVTTVFENLLYNIHKVAMQKKPQEESAEKKGQEKCGVTGVVLSSDLEGGEVIKEDKSLKGSCCGQ